MDKQLNNVSVQLYRETLNRGHDLDIKVGGSSMWPFIKDGETLVLRKVSSSDIFKGDVIATYTDEKLTCHRVFRKNKNFIQTKADALVGLDAKISYTDVVGKVIAQKKNGSVHKYSGLISQLMGKCILWFSFLWAPLIPVLRYYKAIFTRQRRSAAYIHTKQKALVNDYVCQLAGLGLGRTLQGDVPSFDANEFLAVAANEGCTGLIYYNFTHYQPNHGFSDTVCGSLEQEYLVNAGRNMLIDKQLNTICTEFERKQLKALTIRGAVFFDQIYPGMGMRPLIDMDFVVCEDDFDCARMTLEELGFDYNECYPFFFYKDNIYVDLHLNSINFWRIKNWPSAIDMTNKKLWQRTDSFRNNTYIRTLDCYDTIIHCSEHLMRHSFERLIWFFDIAYLIRKEAGAFHWDQLACRAKEHGAQKAVYYVLSYLSKMNYCVVPPSILEELGNIRLNILEKKSLSLLLNNQRENISGDLMSLCAIPRFKQKIQMLFNGIFIEKEKFPLVRKKLTPLSYLKRFFRLTGYLFKKSISMIKAPNF